MAALTHCPKFVVRLYIALWAFVLLCVGGCGGTGGGDAAAPMQGTIESHSIVSRFNGNTYPLRIYLPPESAGVRATLPILYALDGDWWFTQLVDIVVASKARVIVVGIGNNAARATDFVPLNTCTLGGGGNAAYLAFIRSELIPYVEGNVGGHPARRALLGHSHGGSFVYYALFADTPGNHPFRSYLASDSSIGCMPQVADSWESTYAASFSALPVRLHMSHTSESGFDIAYAQRIRDRRYANLVVLEQSYNGTHTGIIPMAFADALAFALAP